MVHFALEKASFLKLQNTKKIFEEVRVCFLRFTNLTKPGEKLIKLSKKIKKKNDQIKFCHDLNRIVSEVLDFKTGITNNKTTAEEALKFEKGVCQDYAHILISLSKIFNIPSRYVNGYLH